MASPFFIIKNFFCFAFSRNLARLKKNYMKKILLSLSLIAIGSWSYGQVVVSGVSPASIQGNYEYGTQANCGSWPGEVDDASWGTFPTWDFNTPGVFIQDTLMLADDGTPGLNAQGNPISAEACNPLINDLTGKIAILYRNTCDFATKAYNAQLAGAVAVVIVNREDALIGMTAANPGDGQSVTIPVVFLSSVDGNALIAEMNNGPVVMFIGNKIGAFPNDIGGDLNFLLISPYGATTNMMDNGFDVGIQVYNWGANVQSSGTVNLTIDGPAGNVYDETVALPTMNSTDTVAIYTGFGLELPDFTLASYPNGLYTMTYTIDLGVADDFPFDNQYSSTFTVNDDVISYARIDGAGMPIATSYTSISTGPAELQSCMFYENNQIDVALSGVSFVPHADTSVNELAGSEIFINVYEWNSPWTDLSDVNYFATGAPNDPFDPADLVLAAFETHYPASDDETDDAVMVPFTPIALLSGQRYLVCAQTYDPNVSFGIDNGLNYSGEYNVRLMPFHTIFADQPNAATPSTQWYAAGWDGQSAASIALNVFDIAQLGLNDESIIVGKAFPNPTNNNVTISLEANGNGQLNVTDVAGKIALSQAITLVNGKTNIDMSTLDAGVYIFNVTLENGKSSQFNVVKN